MTNLIITLIFLIALLLGYLLFKKLRKSKMAFIPKTINGKIDPAKVTSAFITETNIILIIDGHAIHFPRTTDLLTLVENSAGIHPVDFTININDSSLKLVQDKKTLICLMNYEDSMLVDSVNWNIENAEKLVTEINLQFKLSKSSKTTNVFKKKS